jgi:hypothetical protein
MRVALHGRLGLAGARGTQVLATLLRGWLLSLYQSHCGYH